MERLNFRRFLEQRGQQLEIPLDDLAGRANDGDRDHDVAGGPPDARGGDGHGRPAGDEGGARRRDTGPEVPVRNPIVRDPRGPQTPRTLEVSESIFLKFLSLAAIFFYVERDI